MKQQTALLIRSAKKTYKAALCSPCTFHLPTLATKLAGELAEAKKEDSCPLAQYRITQLISKLQNLQK